MILRLFTSQFFFIKMSYTLLPVTYLHSTVKVEQYDPLKTSDNKSFACDFFTVICSIVCANTESE